MREVKRPEEVIREYHLSNLFSKWLKRVSQSYLRDAVVSSINPCTVACSEHFHDKDNYIAMRVAKDVFSGEEYGRLCKDTVDFCRKYRETH